MAGPEQLRREYPAGSSLDVHPAADGWGLRRFDWPAPSARPRGSILFQGGRGDIVEKYLETFHHWHDAGWTIGSFDWRGQGGSGRTTASPRCGDIDDFATFVADLGEVWREWAATTPGPHVAMGHSMGGHLVLRAMLEGAITPEAAVLIAPMLGLRAPISPSVGERYARMMARLGDAGRPAWKGNERPYTLTARQKLLTNDPDRYADEMWWHAHDPGLVTGPPSWRWVTGAFASTRQMASDARVERLDTPVLMIVAGADQLVDPRAAVAIGARLPNARVVRFGGESAHEILREADPVRTRALGEIDGFLAQAAPRAA